MSPVVAGEEKLTAAAAQQHGKNVVRGKERESVLKSNGGKPDITNKKPETTNPDYIGSQVHPL